MRFRKPNTVGVLQSSPHGLGEASQNNASDQRVANERVADGWLANPAPRPLKNILIENLYNDKLTK